MDHSEHSVQIVATEHGIADLRGRSPCERACLIIENCAHPDFRDELKGYLEMVEGGHTPTTPLSRSTDFLRGCMVGGVSFPCYGKTPI